MIIADKQEFPPYYEALGAVVLTATQLPKEHAGVLFSSQLCSCVGGPTYDNCATL